MDYRKCQLLGGGGNSYLKEYGYPQPTVSFKGKIVGLNQNITNFNESNLDLNVKELIQNHKCEIRADWHEEESERYVHQMIKPVFNLKNYTFHNCYSKCNKYDYLRKRINELPKEELVPCNNGTGLSFKRKNSYQIVNNQDANLFNKIRFIDNQYYLTNAHCEAMDIKKISDDSDKVNSCRKIIENDPECIRRVTFANDLDFRYKLDGKRRVSSFEVGLKQRHSWKRNDMYVRSFNIDALLGCGIYNEKEKNIKAMYVTEVDIDDFSEVFINNKSIRAFPYQELRNIIVCPELPNDSRQVKSNKRNYVYQNDDCSPNGKTKYTKENGYVWNIDFNRVWLRDVGRAYNLPSLPKINFVNSLKENGNYITTRTIVENGGSMWYKFAIEYYD